MASVTVTSENVQEFAANGGKFPEAPAAAEVKETVADAKPEQDDDHEEKEGKRFAKIRVERNEARRAAEEARKEAADLKARIEALENGPNSDEEPKPEKFTDPVEYAKALAKFLTAKERKEEKERQAKETAEAEQKRVIQAWNKQWAKISKEYEDFEEVTSEQIAFVQPTVNDAIYESEIGPRLAYFFSKNRDELDKINEMGVKAALKYLGRIEAKIELDLERAKEKPAVESNVAPRRKIAEAPEPITPVRGIGSTSTANVNNDGEVTNSKAFRAEMRKQLYGH